MGLFDRFRSKPLASEGETKPAPPPVVTTHNRDRDVAIRSQILSDDWSVALRLNGRLVVEMPEFDDGLDPLRSEFQRLGPIVDELVVRYLDSGKPAEAFLTEFRSIASIVRPLTIQFIKYGEPIQAAVGELTGYYSVLSNGKVAAHCRSSSSAAWEASNRSGKVVKVSTSHDAALLMLSFGAGLIVDPESPGLRYSIVNDQLLDPLTNESWDDHPDAGSSEPRNVAVTARRRVNFLFVGGEATLVLHDGTFVGQRTDSVPLERSWIVEDRMVESEDWFASALTRANQLLTSEGSSDSFGLVWRTPHFAGPSVKIGKKLLGPSFKELGHVFHDETGRDVTHDMRKPTEKWAWVRSFFNPPTLKAAASSGGWVSNGDTIYGVCPAVALIATVELQSRLCTMLDAMPGLDWVVCTDTPRMRLFAQRFNSGATFEPSDDLRPRLDHWKWKHVERGSIEGNFDATILIDASNREIEAAGKVLRYLYETAVRVTLTEALADPIIREVAQLQPSPPYTSNARLVSASEKRIAEYRKAWTNRQSCLFYETVPSTEAGDV